jgi:hypothetical protein
MIIQKYETFWPFPLEVIVKDMKTHKSFLKCLSLIVKQGTKQNYVI